MQRKRPGNIEHHHACGFTMIEMIISLTVMSIIAIVLVPLLQMPMRGYVDAERRTELQAQMALVRSQLEADLARAVPGSLRVRQVGARRYLEYLEAKAVGRVRTNSTGGPGFCPATTCQGGDALATACAAETCFTSIGSPVDASGTAQAPAVGDYVAIMPASGALTLPLNNFAYVTTANSPTVRLTAAAAVSDGWGLRFAAHTFRDQHPQRRFYLIRRPVSVVCDPAARTLIKRTGYALQANQPTVFGAGVASATLSNKVQSCQFNLSAPTAAAANAPDNVRQVLSVQLALAIVANGVAAEQTQSEMQFVVREP